MLMTQLKNDYYGKVNQTENKITDINHEKYITTEEFHKLRTDNVTGRLGAKMGKNDIADFRRKDRL